MAVYTINEDGIAEAIRPDLTQAEVGSLIQAGQIAEGIPISSCIKDTLAVVTGKKIKQLDGEV
jgi:2-C-methyl-D-erythritol 4-phosphate cytidylyltransferase